MYIITVICMSVAYIFTTAIFSGAKIAKSPNGKPFTDLRFRVSKIRANDRDIQFTAWVGLKLGQIEYSASP